MNKKMRNITIILLMAVMSMITACGGGGGAANTAPTAAAQSVTTDEDVALPITLSGSDADGNPLTYAVNNPAHGVISGTAPNVTYTPNANYNGTDTFSFTVKDATGESASASISIMVNPVNDLVSFQAADIVIGQADFTGTNSNQGGSADANTIAGPYGNPGVANGILYLPEYSNNRLLGFNAIPAVNNAVADFVLGQPDFTTTNSALSATGFDGTQTVAFDGNKMFLLEYGASRVLIWNSIPTSGGIPADIVLGQSDFTTGASGTCSDTGLASPETLWAANGKLVVTDTDHHRVLIWNSIPASDNVAADIVLGQQDFTHCAANDTNNDGTTDAVSASTLDRPAGVWTDGTRLVVLDKDNNRALIWNTFPTSNFTPADVVLGQSDFVNNTANDDDQDGTGDGGPTARTLDAPYDGVYSNGRQLYITDTDNNRVLIWNEFPTSNFTPADAVLGQAGFTLQASNDSDGDGVSDSASAQTLDYPTGVYLSGSQLIVADESNNRYLIYNE